jgi:tRNA threonylcarbamoyladenosine biosynthesis protein TsaE
MMSFVITLGGNEVPEMFLPDEAATEQLGAALAALTPPGGTWLLKGDLGAGKTTWARGFVAGLGGCPEQVSSPTYSVLHGYATPAGKVYHLDLYRLGPSEVWALGIEDSVSPSDRLIVEWPCEEGPWSTDWVSVLELAHAAEGRAARYSIAPPAKEGQEAANDS